MKIIDYHLIELARAKCCDPLYDASLRLAAWLAYLPVHACADTSHTNS